MDRATGALKQVSLTADVARRAGVSPALISKILKPGSTINAKTAERILALG